MSIFVALYVYCVIVCNIGVGCW